MHIRRITAAIAAIAIPLTMGAGPAAAAPDNGEGEPRPSTTVGSAALPEHQLTGYWQNFVNNAEPLRVSDVPDNYDLVALAFAQSDATRPGAVKFSVDPELSAALGGYSDARLKADIAAKQSQGTDFVMSIGGAKGSLNLSTEQRVNNFVDSMTTIIEDYGLNGLDIDLEHSFDTAGLTSAARQLRNHFGQDFLLTMAPQTLYVQPGGSYMQLIDNLSDIITTVHTQYYNSGSMLGCDQQVYSQGSVDFITAQACILLDKLRPDQVALGLPASPSAAGSGHVAPSVVTDALDCLASTTNCGQFTPEQSYPSISGVMTWSINWDVSNGTAFSDAVGAHLDTLP
ncbi:chitinase [Actinopolyspora erythraea]|uniref:chitinase n=1 Tax=Actinopolyspora erythraea TaxID=414996 RepID=A0A099D983_9ACTN|nr:chitinase [Actinopolyspora erythraea]ASU78367.1 chitinase [Actinopolyspora erythraea]KGI81940.1 chitinase [Actinopolyspora erythraea]